MLYFNWGEGDFTLNEKGFTLIEMLASFSILLMISTFILPLLAEVVTERKNLELRNEGSVLLIEQVNHYHSTGNFEENIEIKGAEYHFYKSNNQLHVAWNNRNNKQEITGYEVRY